MEEEALPIEEYYELDLPGIVSVIRKKASGKVGLQLPEGIKQFALDLMTWIEEETGVPCVLSLAPCFGACDLRSHEFALLGVALVLHFGHSEIPELSESYVHDTHPETVFIELSRKVAAHQVKRLAQRIRTLLGSRKGGTLVLTASVQYVHVLPKLVPYLEDEFHVEIPEGDPRLRHPGQILGCNFSVARKALARDMAEDEETSKSKEFIFVGDGRFHPLGLSLAIGREVLAIEPLSPDHQVQPGTIPTITIQGHLPVPERQAFRYPDLHEAGTDTTGPGIAAEEGARETEEGGVSALR